MRLGLAIVSAAALFAQENSIDLGYRGRTDLRGDLDTYRSLVNLGEGPKLLGAQFDWNGFKGSAIGWGGEPYSRTRLGYRYKSLFDVRADYRNSLYFNSLPTFSNPIGTGNERAYDFRRRGIDINLDLLPGSRIVPFFAYERDWNDGRGIIPFVASLNEYPALNLISDSTNRWRGGARIELKKFHVTLEQGGTTFADDQRVAAGDRSVGNRQTLFLGQRLFIDSATQIYRARGDSLFSAARATWSPFSWVDISGQFMWSRPESDAIYNAEAAGLFFDSSTFSFFQTFRDSFASQASLPRSSGSFALELRPFSRLRIVESFMTDRSSNAIELDYSRQQAEAIFDWGPFSIRGGHRYVFGDATIRAPGLALDPTESGELSQHVALAGATWRPSQKLSLGADLEVASADRVYFRTSLRDYRKGTARARYQIFSSLSITASSMILDNPDPDLRLTQSSLSLQWNPAGGKLVSLLGDYTHSSLRSGLFYVAPQDRVQELSAYRDNAHVGTAIVDVKLPGQARFRPQLSLGGSVFASSGSRPSRYYQPQGRFSAALHPRVTIFAEWRWYEYFQTFYLNEAFRTHLIAGGVRISSGPRQ